MGQIFHRSTNTIARATIIGTFLLVGFGFWVIAQVQRSPYTNYVGVARVQPVPFSHQHHVSGLGIDCRYCHTTVEVSSFAGIPPTKTCMNCHSEIWTNAPMLEPIRESFRTGQSIQWVRANDLPDYVYFDHSIHINKGVGCNDCHGPVQRMPLMYAANTLQMEWCLNCHREPEKFLRPRDQVFNMNYQQPGRFNPITLDNHQFTDQISLGNYLKQKYHLRSVQDITSCSTCHR
jgi:hypothetical protein